MALTLVTMLALAAVAAFANWSYEPLAFQCQLLIIAVREYASAVWSAGIVWKAMKYSMSLRIVIHST